MTWNRDALWKSLGCFGNWGPCIENIPQFRMFGHVGMIIWDVQANSFPKTSLFRVLFVASSHPLAKVPGSRLKGPNK